MSTEGFRDCWGNVVPPEKCSIEILQEMALEAASYWEGISKKKTRAYVQALRELVELGGGIYWYCGIPGYRIVPLSFVVYLPDGTEWPEDSSLKALKGAITEIKKRQNRG